MKLRLSHYALAIWATARDIRTDGGVVRGTYDYGRAA